jgi:hypothetical protein
MAKWKKFPDKPNRSEDRTVDALDKLKAYEEFETTVLPGLQEELRKGSTADEIYKKYENLVAARTVTIALTDPNGAVALAAGKEIRDRSSGKSTEKKEVTHRLAALPEEELDAYLLTKLKDRNMLTDEETEDETSDDEEK